MKPLPKVSASKYAKSAKVKWKIKGNKDGAVYQGQKIVGKCKFCPTG